MKVTYDMIDKELRFRGFLVDRIISKPNEARFVNFVHAVKKMTDRVKGKTIPGLDYSQVWLPRPDGSQLRLCVYKPPHLTEPAPGVLWLHGGGFALGVPELFSITYKNLIEARDCVIIAPDYRLSVEAPYPAALEDAYMALLWMKEHAHTLGIRENQLMVGGESAGGGLAAGVAIFARDQGEVNIAFQMLKYPMLDDRGITKSGKKNNAPVWNSWTNEWAWKLYLGEHYNKEVPAYAAPARATDFSGLPPAVSYVGDIEPFRDETIQYLQNLEEAGVPTHFKLLDGCYHGFDIINPNATVTKQTASFFIDAYIYAVDHYFAEQDTMQKYVVTQHRAP